MKVLNLLLPTRLIKTPKWLAIGFLLMSLIGFLDTSYLSAKRFLSSPVTCSFFQGCDQVTTSRFAVIGGVPVAVLGLIYYLIILIGTLIYLDTKREAVLYSLAQLTPIGFIVSVWFIFLQLIVIKALCLYCIVSATTSTILFVLGILLIRKQRQLNQTSP